MEIQNHIHQTNAYSMLENCVGGMYCLLHVTGYILTFISIKVRVSDWSDT